MYTELDKELIKEYDDMMPKGILSLEQARRESTERREEQYLNGEITEEQFCLFATNRRRKSLLKELDGKEIFYNDNCDIYYIEQSREEN